MTRGERRFACLLLPLALGWAVQSAAPVGVAAQAAVAPADDAVTEEARRHLHQARALYEQQNYEAAIVEFQTAYRLRPHHVILYNMGQCYERMLEHVRAYETYVRFMAEAPADDPFRAQAAERVEALESLLATVEVRTNVPRADLWIDGRREGTAPSTIRLSAGSHHVELRARGYGPAAIDVRLGAHERRTLDLRLERAGMVRRGIHPAAFFATAGLAVAAAGAGTVLGVRALDLSDEYEANPARSRADQQAGEDTALAADVLFVGAGVLAVTAGVLLFVTDWGGDDDAEPPGTARATIAPWLAQNRAGVVVGVALP